MYKMCKCEHQHHLKSFIIHSSMYINHLGLLVQVPQNKFKDFLINKR